MYKIAVAIPCFNLGAYVGDAVDSVLAQADAAVEVLLIDDGSTDAATMQRLDELARRERVELLRTPNRGVAAARNSGLERATGEFVMFLDADDRLLPGALRVMAEALAREPQAALAYPAFRRGDDGREIHRPAFNRLALLATNTLSIASLVRRSAVGDARFRTTDRGFEYEDWDFWLQLTDRAPALYVPQALYEYRIRPHSRGQAGNRHYAEVIDDLHRFNAASYAPAALMAAKRRWCPALTIRARDDGSFAHLTDFLGRETTLDAQVIHVDEEALGKFILDDQGGKSLAVDVLCALLKRAETYDAPPAVPPGWRFSWASAWQGGVDPTTAAARRYLAENDLAALGAMQERLWRLSCPAWTETSLPENIDALVGEIARARYAVGRLRDHGLLPYALFGAGMHTQRLLAADAFVPLPRVIFDDHPPVDKLSGVPVCQPAPSAELRAVIVSSDAHERTLFARAREMFPSPLPVLRLYS
ncbi:MAG TPA: glycosyltransferase family A protein [bacterium]|nr:glycosyltransferase family A protein [bacterium]